MQNKTVLLRSFLLVLLGTLFLLPASVDAKKKTGKYQHWIWINPSRSDTDEQLATKYKKYHEAGIVGIFFEADSERHYRMAKKQGLEAHRWMWIMNRGELVEKHPDWYAQNRNGESCATHPPYVGYYRWLCPSRPEVAVYLESDVRNTLDKDYVDGIHLDYIRYSDVILAVNLWDVYKIVQKEEKPEYDFCYCNVCKTKFKEQYNQDVDLMEYPEESLSWKRYRYDAVNNIVANLTKVAKDKKKDITAAVFPTPEVALRKVRQDWTAWELTGIYPMIYHGFYKEDVPWIGTAVKECLRGIHGRYPLYAGLYLPDFKNKEEIRQGISIALQSGAKGVSLFGNVDDEVLEILKAVSKQ